MSLSFRGEEPPWLGRAAGHEAGYRNKDIQYAWILAGGCQIAELLIHFVRTSVYEISGFGYSQLPETAGHGWADIWQVRNFSDLCANNFVRIHGIHLVKRKTHSVMQSIPIGAG